jgi:asparagine synthetase B (glutamine-hydrolysing)
MQALRKAGVRRVICGDVIDEILGGYYEHQRGPEAFRRCLDLLIPRHLEALDRCSTEAGVEVYLPYASAVVLDACRAYPTEELATPTSRKRPMYRLAQGWNVPVEVQTRRKLGLDSVLS